MNTLIAASIYTDLLNQAVAFAGTVLLLAATALVAKLREHAGVKMTQEQETALDAIIAKGIALAEEVARKKVASIKLTGDDKLGIALKFVLSQIDAQGLEKKAEKEIEDRIHATLGTTRKLDPMFDIAANLMSVFAPKPPTSEPVAAPVPPAAPVEAPAPTPAA